MTIIAHYIATLRFCRVHLSFKDTENIKHHYLVPNFKKNSELKNVVAGTEAINSPNKYTFNNHDRDIPNLLNKIKPQIMLCSNTLSLKLLEFCKKNNIKIFYIRHGIANSFSINVILKNIRRCGTFKNFDGYITHTSEKYQYIKMGIPEKNIYCIEGSTMIDYLKSIDLKKMRHQILSQICSKTGNFANNPSDPINPDKKCILFLQNHQGVLKYNSSDRKQRSEAVKEYCLILERLVNYANKHDMHIFTKIKGTGGDMMKILKNKSDKLCIKIKTLHDNPRVTVLFFEQEVPMYHFLFSDVVVVEACGTSLPESFIVNKKTIQCQVLAINDYYDIDKYNLLPQADNLDQLDKWIDNLLFNEEQIITPEYIKQSNEFVAQFYGKVEQVTDKIVKLLESNI